MTKSFRSLIEDIESVVDGSPTPAQSVYGDEFDWEGVVLEDASDDDDEWTPADAICLVHGIIEAAIAEGMDEDDAVEALRELLDEAAYKWSHGIQPDEKNVTPDIGTVDEPSHAREPSGRGSRKVYASGLPTSKEELRRVIINTLSKRPPKPIKEYPVEVGVEVWLEVLAQGINRGWGFDFEKDKSGALVPVLDYSKFYGIWKDRMDKLTGTRPSREKDTKMKHSLDKSAKEDSKILRKKGVSKREKTRASTVLRGRRGKMNPNRN